MAVLIDPLSIGLYKTLQQQSIIQPTMLAPNTRAGVANLVIICVGEYAHFIQSFTSRKEQCRNMKHKSA